MGLRPFNEALSPSLDEIGIDRIRFRLRGRWSGRGSAFEHLQRYIEYIGSDGGPFERVGVSGRRSFLTIPSSSPLTLRGRFTFVRDLEARSNVYIELDANPTRTFEHLLLWHGGDADFAALIAALDPDDFFAAHPEPRLAAGGSDNLLSNVPLARLRMGADPFATFLPCYVRQLGTWVERALTWHEFEPTVIRAAGITDISIPAFSVRLDWTEISLRLVEVYFERNHPDAHFAIERLARSALAGHSDVHVHRYVDEPDELNDGNTEDADEGLIGGAWQIDHVRRDNGELAVSGTLVAGQRRYTIYAKTDQRLRFELKNEGLPVLTPLPSDDLPSCVLFRRLEAARQALPTSFRWNNVGAMCAPLPAGDAGMLADLVARIEDALRGEPDGLGVAILRELLTSGGITESEPTLPRRLIERLERRQVVERRPFRQRGRRHAGRRYLLCPPFMAVREMLGGTG